MAFFSLLLSSDLNLIIDTKVERDGDEAPEKWELGLPAAFEGQWERTTARS